MEWTLHRLLEHLQCSNIFTLKTGELPVETLAELRAGELTAEPVAIMLEERARVELERLSELDVSLVVELNVELLLCKLT